VDIVFLLYYNDQLAFGSIYRYSSSCDKEYEDQFFKCSEETAKYLNSVFKDKNTKPYLRKKDNEYTLYIPVTIGKEVYVLEFSKTRQYGRYGS
jgi:hypothetical protein